MKSEPMESLLGKKTVDVLGTPLLLTTYAELAHDLLAEAATAPGPVAVDFMNTHVVTLRRHDRSFEALCRGFDINLPDGMPLVWVMNTKGAGLRDRVYGPAFTRDFLRNCPAGPTHYVLGGSPECGERFRSRMLSLNPSLRFVGCYHGDCSAGGILEHDDEVTAEILAKRPDFIWVGLGTPKQYAWIARIKPLLSHGVLLAIGFALDANAGTKPDAPDWMQRWGLTWLYRMACEPRRLLRRYLKWNTLFLMYLAKELLFGQTPSRASGAQKP
jgi:N-acetylglucosaminyldiphosphoundecaprenol N-acetyl-beta-D-mannosaminyltransferase